MNHLHGDGGNDKMTDGADRINGGLQAGTLTGGASNDTFVYRTVWPARPTATPSTGHRINLITIDAKASMAATNESFSFIGTAAFGYHEGELRYQAPEANSLIQGDVNGDGMPTWRLC